MAVGILLILGCPKSAAASSVIVEPQVSVTASTEETEPKRYQFRARLLRNWWQFKRPRYVIYQSRFYKY